MMDLTFGADIDKTVLNFYEWRPDPKSCQLLYRENRQRFESKATRKTFWLPLLFHSVLLRKCFAFPM